MENDVEKSAELPVIIAQSGPLEGQRWTIEGPMTIGRDPDAGLVIATPDKQVSRHHATLTPTAQGILIKDLGSKNGTQVNGETITEPVMLLDGDTIQIAMAQQFVFLSSDATVPLQVSQMKSEGAGKGALHVDKRARRVFVGSKEIVPPLSVAQYSMLEILYDSNGEVVSRLDVIRAVWGEEDAYEVSNQALDALVRRLRERLAEVDDHEYVITVRGHGLRLDNPPK